MERGCVKNWEAMEKVWNHIVANEMRIEVGGEDSDVNGVFLTEPCLNSHTNREKECQYWFETQNVGKCYMALQGVLTLIGYGNHTGVVLNSGHSVTEVMPIFNYYPMQHAFNRINLAGVDVTARLKKQLHKSGPLGVALESSSDDFIINTLKEKCYVAMRYEEEKLALSKEGKKFTLPDKTSVTINEEIVSCPEILFQPIMDGKDIPGVHTFIKNAVDACPMDTMSEMLNHVLLSGGNTMFQHYKDRLQEELSKMCGGEESGVKVLDKAERSIISWIGGNIVTDLSLFEKMYLTKQTYEEDGISSVHRMSPS